MNPQRPHTELGRPPEQHCQIAIDGAFETELSGSAAQPLGVGRGAECLFDGGGQCGVVAYGHQGPELAVLEDLPGDARAVGADHGAAARERLHQNVREALPRRRQHEDGRSRHVGQRVERKAGELHILADVEQFGTWEVELDAVEQIVERAQTKAMAEALVWGKGRHIDGERDFAAALHRICSELADGLDVMKHKPVGDFAQFRVFELAAFLNRLRSLRVE